MSPTQKKKSTNSVKHTTQTPLKSAVESVDHKVEELSHESEKKASEVSGFLAPLTQYLDKLYSKWPVLPPSLVTWIGKYAWIFSIASAVLLGLSTIRQLIDTLAHVTLYNLFILLEVAVMCVLYTLAYKPLKEGRQYGWNLLYCTTLVSYASTIISYLIVLNGTQNIIQVALYIAFQVLFTVVALWFVFGLRSAFTKK